MIRIDKYAEAMVIGLVGGMETGNKWCVGHGLCIISVSMHFKGSHALNFLPQVSSIFTYS